MDAADAAERFEALALYYERVDTAEQMQTGTWVYAGCFCHATVGELRTGDGIACGRAATLRVEVYCSDCTVQSCEGVYTYYLCYGCATEIYGYEGDDE